MFNTFEHTQTHTHEIVKSTPASIFILCISASTLSQQMNQILFVILHRNTQSSNEVCGKTTTSVKLPSATRADIDFPLKVAVITILLFLLGFLLSSNQPLDLA